MDRKTLLASFEARKEEVVDLTSRLIRINSENPTGSQRSVIDFVKQYLADGGIDAEEVAVNDDHPCVVARIGREDGYSIILNGHVDVVPAGDLSRWDFDPFGGEITETRILGRGTSDMKAGVAGILFVMRLLRESGVELQGNVRLHIVSDEETGGQYGTAWLVSEGYADDADACLVAEPTSKYTIEIGQKGSNELILKAYGTPAHGSLGNYKGDNAVVKLARVLGDIERLHEIRGHFAPEQEEALANSKYIAANKLRHPGIENVIDHVTASVGLISGGTKLNVVPDYAEARVDIRLPCGADTDEVEQKLRDILEGSGVDYEVEWQHRGNHTDIRAPIVEAVRRHGEAVWDIEILPAYQWASSDAKFYRQKGIQTIQYGPSNTEGIHSYNETVDIDDVINAARIYLLSICDLLNVK